MEKNVKLRFILNCCSLQKIQDFKIGFLLLFYLFLFLFTDFCIAESKFIDLTDHHKKPPVIYLKPKGLENWDKFISTNIKINGSNRTKIECGDSVKLDFSFFPGRQKAEFSVFIDCNNNDILDAEDIQYGKSITFIDGDSNDLDKKLNSHYSTAISNLPETDIPVSSIIGRTIFFQINDGINCSIAVLKIKPAIKSFFFSGLIRNPENKANLAVIIQSNDRIRQKKYLILTDEYGYFYAEIPDCSNDPYYFVSSDDLFNVLNNNYFAPLPEVLDKRIKPNKIYLSYSIKTSFLNGRITDLEGNSIQNVRVLVQNAENSSESTMYSSVCDSAGYFRIGVIPGLYKISLASETLFPNYMFPEENTPVNVLEGQAKDIQLKVLKTDSFIKGKVIIEGKAARDIYVAAWNDKGSIWGKTKNDGTFLLNVNKNYHYNIDVNPESIPPGYFPVFSNTRTVKPDSGIVEFIFKKA